jgi:hypothetical protein
LQVFVDVEQSPDAGVDESGHLLVLVEADL